MAKGKQGLFYIRTGLKICCNGFYGVMQFEGFGLNCHQFSEEVSTEVNRCLQTIAKHGGGPVMVWCSISASGYEHLGKTE